MILEAVEALPAEIDPEVRVQAREHLLGEAAHPWSRGGGTSVDQGRLLCSRHHHLAHHPPYVMVTHQGRKVSFSKRE